MPEQQADSGAATAVNPTPPLEKELTMATSPEQSTADIDIT